MSTEGAAQALHSNTTEAVRIHQAGAVMATLAAHHAAVAVRQAHTEEDSCREKE